MIISVPGSSCSPLPLVAKPGMTRYSVCVANQTLTVFAAVFQANCAWREDLCMLLREVMGYSNKELWRL